MIEEKLRDKVQWGIRDGYQKLEKFQVYLVKKSKSLKILNTGML